jgi:hypothetical protein
MVRRTLLMLGGKRPLSHSEAKMYVKIHSDTKGHVKFHSGYFIFYS